MTTRSRADHFRRVVLEAAADLFAMHEDVSMAEIAEAAGVGRATLYRHYDSREALVVDLADFACETAGQALIDARLDDVGVEEAFQRAFRAIVGVGSRFAFAFGPDPHAPDGAAGERLRLRMTELVERGRREGVLGADVPATCLLVGLRGALLSAVELAREVGPEDAAAFGARLFLHGTAA